MAGATKWHVYRYPQRPGTLMVLGSILTEPDDLKSSLNYESGIKAFPNDKRQDDTDTVRQAIQNEMSTTHGGHLKAMLPVPAAIANAETSSAQAILDALDIHAESIVPDTASAHINEALSVPAVVNYVRKGNSAKPLYLIVGVATCKRLSTGDSSSRRRTDASVGSELEGKEECVFAYRVKKLQYSSGRGADVQGAAHDDGLVFEGFESQDEDVNSLTVLDGLAMQIVI